MARTLNRRSLLTLGGTALVHGAAKAAGQQETGTLLTDDFSRADIFRQFVVDPWLVSNSSESLTLAIPSSFHFPDDVQFDCTTKTKNVCVTDKTKLRPGAVMFGVDINHYTNSADFSFNQLRAQKVSFVQMKASQGSTFKDGNFPLFWKKAGELPENRKVFRGPYHFLTATGEGRKQADWFTEVLDKAGGLTAADMAPGIDLEWDVYKSTGKLDHWKDKGEQFIMDTVLGCLDRLKEKTGRTPVIYTGRTWFGPHTLPLSRFKDLSEYPLWVFDFDAGRKIEERPLLPDNSIAAALWQFTDSARVPVCYSGGLDASVFYGSETDFRHVFGIV